MDIASVMHELCKRDIALYVEQGAIRVKAPKGALTDDLRQMIREHKAEIIAALSEEAPADDTGGTSLRPADGSLSVAPPGEFHSVNPQTGKRFITHIAHCPRCGGTSWGETGRLASDGTPSWGCLHCTNAVVD